MRIIGRILAWLAVLAMPGLTWGLAHVAMALWNEQGPVIRVEDLVTLGAAVVGTAVAGYLTLTGGAMLLGAAVRGGRTIPRSIAAFAPSSWQRVTAAALGVTISAGLAAPALASSPTSPHVGWGEPGATDSQQYAVGFVPAPVTPVAVTTVSLEHDARDRRTVAEVAEVAEVAASNHAPADGAETYTVKRGDSLWRITAGILGPTASDASIRDAWPELYAANTDVVGPDPSLIHPGLVLTIPQGLSS